MPYKDLFSSIAADYATYRPDYPRVLFRYLASIAPNHTLAWDSATGNGQAAFALKDFFDRVMATDASKGQIREAKPDPKITYAVCPAEKSILRPKAVALTTVAQALHWLVFDDFYGEVRRVSADNAVIAVWCYRSANISSEIDECVRNFYFETLGRHWPPERRWIDEEFKTIPFPFPEISAPKFNMEKMWNLHQWLRYVRTWSATQLAIKKEGETFFEDFARALAQRWGTEDLPRPISWPLHLRVGRVSG